MRYLLSLILICSSIVIWAQPVNDNCNGVIDLGTAPVCPETIYDNINSTPTDIGNDNSPGCFQMNPPQNDVWFQFITDAVITDYTISVISTADGLNDPIDNIQFSIYRGFCATDALFLNACVKGDVGDQNVELDLVNLTPSELYYIRIDNFGDNNAEGDFKICIEEKSPDINIDQGSSNDCSGTLYDSGGPDGNYGDNEDFTFVICPQEFHQCVEFNLEYYNIEGGFNGDNMEFFNGPDINSPFIGQLNGGGFDDGGGGVCYTVRADSCLTIRFTSGNGINFEGFKGNWECFLNPCKEDAPLVINEGASKSEIEEAISTPLAQVKVDTIICDQNAFGTFSNGNATNLGMNKGLILTSGTALNAIGPNNTGSASGFANTPGDDDLDILSDLFGDGSFSNDACVVEVDVTVYANQLNFEYIFGSEEYPEFVNQFNDIFALLIEGPGIDGIPELNGKDNMAVLPGTSEPISINSVNNILNWEYYRNNDDGQSIQYDGLTSGFLGNKKTLTATAVVEPCSTYHLKFAVADRGDTAFDSGVFISEIKSGTPEIGTKFASGLDYFVEKCLGGSKDTIIIFLDEAVTEESIYTVVIGGTANSPSDYVLDIPNTIVFQPGQIEARFGIEVFDDSITEGDETITITLFRNFGCGDVEVTSSLINIRENIKVEIDLAVDNDSLIICAGNTTQLIATGATSYTWSPFTVLNDPFIANPIVDAGFEGWIYVIGNIDPFVNPECIGFDSVYINLVDPEIEIQTMDKVQVCTGDTVTLTAINNLNDMNITWDDPFDFMDVTTGPIVNYVPTFGFDGFTQVVTVTVSLNGCIAQDTITISIDPFTIVTPLFQDTVICQNTEVQLNEQGFSFNGTLFNWNPETYIDNPTTAFTFSTPDEDIDYELIVTSPNGFCADTFNYSIAILPNEINILEGEEVRMCLGDTLNLNSIFQPNDATITWTPTQFTIDKGDGKFSVFPPITTVYTVTSDNGICSASTEVKVFVDSLPLNMEITAIPVRDPYCFGEVITFISPAYKPFRFPLMEHNWSPGFGVQSELTDYNLVLGASETATYIRTTTNGACTTMDSIMINVIKPELTINLSDTTVCSGASVPFDISGNGELENIEWSTGSGEFTCEDCPDPTLENIIESTTVQVDVEIDGCPISAFANITIETDAPPTIIIPGDTIICDGGDLDLSIIPPGVVDNIIWTSGSGTFSCDDCPNPTLSNINQSTVVNFEARIQGCLTLGSINVDTLGYSGITTFQPDTICNFYGDVITINAEIFPDLPEGSSISWFIIDEDGNNVGQEELFNMNPAVTTLPGSKGNRGEISLNYTWNVVDPNGCTGSGGGLICVKDRFDIPNAFSPGNQDEINDIFRIVDFGSGLSGVEVVDFSVYNRWGQKVFECEDFECATETGWDGTYNQEKQPSGTYFYYVKLRYPDGNELVFKGDVLLMR